jgi:hypothetical protein
MLQLVLQSLPHRSYTVSIFRDLRHARATMCDCGSAEGLFVENVAGHIKCYISVAWYATIHILMHAQNLRYQFPVIYDEIFETQ